MKTYRPLGVRLLLWAALGFLATTVKSTTASSSVADASGVDDSFSLDFIQPPATLHTESMVTSVSATTPAFSTSDGANSQQTTGQSAPLVSDMTQPSSIPVSSTTQPSTVPASSTTPSSTGTTDSNVASTSSDLSSVPGVSGGITASAPQQTSSSERLAVDSITPISSVITPSTVPSTSVDMTSTTNAPLSSDYDGSTTATASVMPSSDIGMTLGQSTTVDGGTVTLATSVSDITIVQTAPADNTMSPTVTITSIGDTPFASSKIDSSIVSSSSDDSPVISPTLVNSPMVSSSSDSPIISSTFVDSSIVSATVVDSHIFPSSSDVTSSSSFVSSLYDSMVTSSSFTDSSMISSSITGGMMSSSMSTDSSMMSSLPADSAVVYSSLVDSSVLSSAPDYSSMVSSAPIDSTMISSAPIDSTIISSAPIDSTMISSAPIDSTMISSAPIDSTMISSAPIDSTMISSAPIDSTVISSAPIDSTMVSSAPVSSSLYPYSSTLISSLMDSTVISSPMDSTLISSPMDSTLISSLMDSTVISSPMGSTVISSPMDSTVISSPIDSSVISSPIDSTVIMPSSVIETQPTSSFPTTAFSLDSSFQQSPSSDFIVSTVAMETPSLHSSSAFSTSNQIVSASPTSVVMDSASEQSFSTVVVMDTTTEIPDTTVFFFDTTTDVPVTTMVVMETTTEQPDTTMVVMNSTSWLPDVTATVAMTTSAGVGLTTDVSWNTTDTTTPIPLTTTERMLNTSQVFSQYWMKTEILVPVTENVSDSSFSSKMEARLASLYNQAIQMDYDIMRGRYDPGGSGRNRRAITDGNATIQMTGISRHSEVDFNTDLLYYLVENGSMTDVSRTEYLINMFTPQEVAIALGYVVENQGKRYIPLPVHDRKLWIIGAVVGALVAVIVIIWLVLFIYIKCTRPSSLSPRSPRQKQAEAGLGSYPRDVKGFDFVRTEVGLRSDRQQQQQSSENEYHRRYQHPSSGELDTPPPTYPGVSRQSSASEGHKSRGLTDSPGSSRKTNGQAHCASPKSDSFEEGSDYTETAPLKLSTLKGQRSRSPKKPRIKKKEAGDEYSTGLVRPTKLPPLNLETRQNGDVATRRNKQGLGPKKPIRTPSHKGSQDSNGVITGSHEDTRQVVQKKKKKTKRNAPVPPEKSDLIEMNTLTGSHSTALLGPQARLRQDTAMDLDDQLESDDSQAEPTEDPRLRMHELLDQAFSLVTPFQDSDDKSKEALSQETKDRGQKHEPLQVSQYKRQPHDYAHSLWQPHDVSDEAAKILTDSLPPGSIATPTPAMKQPRNQNRSGRKQPRVHHADEIANPAYMTDDLHNPAQSLMQSVKTPQDFRKSLVPDNYTSIAMDTRTFNGDALPTSQVKRNSKVEKPHQPNKTPSEPMPDLTNNVSHLHNGLKTSKPSSSVIGQRGTKMPATNGKIFEHIENSDDDDDEVDVVSRVMKPGNKSEPLVASIREELERLAHRPNEAAPGLSYSVRT